MSPLQSLLQLLDHPMGQEWGVCVPLTLPSPCSYFGFITKHPVLSRFACHVFVSQESMRHVAECVG